MNICFLDSSTLSFDDAMNRFINESRNATADYFDSSEEDPDSRATSKTGRYIGIIGGSFGAVFVITALAVLALLMR